MANSRISREKQETIIATYETEGSINKAAKAADVSWSTAKKYIIEVEEGNCDEELKNIREQKKREIIQQGWQNITEFMRLMKEKAPDAKLREVTGAFAQTVEKIQLLTGEPTERQEQTGEVVNTEKKEIIMELKEQAQNDPETARAIRNIRNRIKSGEHSK